jgi:NAD(P)-dependent dehydrogenase (short-subunit alcohol dehydrogenase family)
MRRSVVVTGAARGIGRATAVALAASGWRVVAVDLDEQGLDALARETASIPVAGDVTDAALLERAAAGAGPLLGAWVNNVGVNVRGRLDKQSLNDVEAMVRTNLIATIAGCQIALRSFVESRTAGSIVNISSIHARAGFPECAVYDACKGGIEALTRSICVEYAPAGIRANAVAPGAVATEAVDEYIDSTSDPEETRRVTDALAPAGRMAASEEVAAVVTFLLSPAANAINGETIAVDGGSSARCFAYEPDEQLVTLFEHAERSTS